MDSLTLLYDFGKTKVLQRFFIAKGCKRKHRFLQVRPDVLIISDFYFPLPIEPTKKKMLIEHNKGTRFYGLKIDSTDKQYDKILDKTWNIK